MNRRTFLGMTSSAVLARFRTAEAAVSIKAPADKRPNFLFLIADDLMFRTINSINNPEVHTPNLDKLVGRGCHFTHCF
ncbi:MAG: sulfatase, partial [Acidobacteriales bacterium]|nr:sulfatase [Terriglobales bacterium]